MKRSITSRVWNDPVWSKVIAATILFVAGVVFAYFQGWWPNVGRTVLSAAAWIQGRSPIPNWLLAVFSLCTLLVIGFGVVILWAIVFPVHRRAGWQSYATDEFFGIQWRWHYGSDGAIYGLCSFCPACDYQVYATNASAFRTIDRIAYHCEDCGLLLGEFDMSAQEMENRVIRAIQKKLRTGTWPKAELA